MDVNVERMHGCERDEHLARRPKIRRIIQRHFVVASLIMEVHERRRRRSILESAVRRIRRSQEFKIEIRRSRIVRELKRPRRANGNRRIGARVGRNRPRRRERVEPRPRGAAAPATSSKHNSTTLAKRLTINIANLSLPNSICPYGSHQDSLRRPSGESTLHSATSAARTNSPLHSPTA